MENLHSASTDAECNIPEGRCVLTYAKLDVNEIIELVKDDGAGAVATFIGVH
jgi:molybdopterin synthase catalytic subunit